MGRIQAQLRRLTIPILLAVLGLPARAEPPRALPAGTVIVVDGEKYTTNQPYWLSSRAQLDAANTAAEMERRLERQLVTCSEALAEAEEPPPQWQVAVKWGALGVAIGGAFALGVIAAR